ncbi:MAG: phage tail sheath subtilisin-like domain-containing protein [Patescibacteria group bacterium]|nr:phage tail sheath subtilisin-like domain-containing protein [Patescibacteria group bacterium]
MPNFSLSPSVEVREIDLTTVIPAVSSSIGAIAGPFTWGPVEEIVTVTTEDELAKTFGKPDNNNFATFFSAANFLSYSGNLRVVRVVGSAAKNAVATGASGTLVKNAMDYETKVATLSSYGPWVAKYPGALGNSIKVSICDAGGYQRNLTETVASGGNTGSTTITASGSLTGKIVVGDWVSFGTSTTKYKVASVSGSNITLATALTENVTGTIKAYWEYYDMFPGAPGTSTYASGKGASNDEVHVVVVDRTGLISGMPEMVLEKYAYLSKAADAKKDDGTSNYYRTVINKQSAWIWWAGHPTGGTNWGNNTLTSSGATAYTSLNTPITSNLSNGIDGSVTSADEIKGYDLFKSGDNVDINLVITGAASTTTVIDIISNLVEKRKDCMAFISPPLDAVLNNVGNEVSAIRTWRNGLPSSSYVVADSGWKYQYDKYNDTFRWVPLNGDIAGICARTDAEGYPWYSPAGYTKGQVKNVIKLAWNPGSKAIRDDLYNMGVNSVVSFTGRGTVLFGDKTLLSKPSAFDRINVRRLFIVLEKAIATAAQYSLFELNDDFTRARFKAACDQYLSGVKGARGVYDFLVVCDSSNNTPDVIDSNMFVGDIYIKPTRSINYIQLNFVAVGTGVSFSEKVLGR